MDLFGFGSETVRDDRETPRAKDILKDLRPFAVVGSALVKRIGARGWEPPRLAKGRSLFKRCGLTDPWDPNVTEVDVALGDVGLPQSKRTVAPHAAPPGASKPAASPFPNVPWAGSGQQKDPFPNAPRAPVKDPFPNAPRASSTPGIRPDDPFPNLPARPSGPPKAGIRPDDPFPNLPARPSGPPKSGIRPDDPFPNLPARPSGPPQPQRAPNTSPLAPTKRTGVFGPPPTKHAVTKLPMRPGVSAPAESAPVIEPPPRAPAPKPVSPVISGRPSEAPRLSNVAASAGGVAAPPQRPVVERPVVEPPSAVAGEPPTGPRPPTPVNRTPPGSKSGGGLDDLFGMGGGDTRIRMPKAEDTGPKKPAMASQEDLAKQGVDRRPPPPKPPVVKPSGGGGGGFNQEGM